MQILDTCNAIATKVLDKRVKMYTNNSLPEDLSYYPNIQATRCNTNTFICYKGQPIS